MFVVERRQRHIDGRIDGAGQQASVFAREREVNVGGETSS
jgi:hypothetical protein